MTSTNKTVLITGCSSGIGYELMKLFDRPGYRIVATALPTSMPELEKDPATKSPRIALEALDIADYQRASEIVDRHAPIDILVNNAGISYRSVVEDMTIDDELRQMQVNYIGPMHLIRECLPSMRRRSAGHIINVSSVGGMMAMPTMASYSASKFALEGASESLWYELKPWGIKVSLVRPGFINSLAFTKVLYSQKKRNGLSDDEYLAHYQNMTQFVENIMRRTPSTSQDVAKRIYKLSLKRNPPLRVAGTPDASLFYLVRRLLPRFLYHKLLFATLPGVKAWGPQSVKPPVKHV